MNLKLKNIHKYGKDDSMIFISIEVNYGWKGKMYGDIIKVNYNSIKRDAYITVKLKNPGVGHVIEHLVEYIATIDFKDKALINPPRIVIEKLADKFDMEYDFELVNNVLGS